MVICAELNKGGQLSAPLSQAEGKKLQNQLFIGSENTVLVLNNQLHIQKYIDVTHQGAWSFGLILL